MNLVVLTGRLTRDPEVRYSNNESQTAVAHYTLAVDRMSKSNGGQEADFIRCTAFGKSAEFAEKWLRKGLKINVTGRIQTGSYTNSENQKIYTTDVIVSNHEFCESKSAARLPATAPDGAVDGFLNIPDNIEEDLPFS